MNILARVWNALRSDTPTKPTVRASTSGYDAGSYGRRAAGWNAPYLGPNSIAQINLETVRARSRDAIRNNPIARSASDKWVSNVIGPNGITPHFLHKDPTVRTAIQQAWTKWARQCDYDSQLNFGGILALAAEEMFCSGETFIRYDVRPSSDGLFVPLTLQVIASELCPLFENSIDGDSTVKSGIVFDQRGHRTGYQLYQSDPNDNLIAGNNEIIVVPADDVLHCYKKSRAGQLRGIPQLAPVLTALRDLGDFSDSERARKKFTSNITGFVEQTGVDDSIFPPSPINIPHDLGTDLGKLEAGSLINLFPGEKVTFPTLPESNDYQSFMYEQLHQIAASIGISYEMMTMEMRGVSFSSARVSLIESRRLFSQFQNNVIIHGLCEPITRRFIKEAVLCGALDLPGYFDDPSAYEEAIFLPSAWEWIDPSKDIAAYQSAVRSGFTSRTQVVREQGRDPEIVDAQTAEDNARADALGIVYDTNASKILIGKESQPLTEEDPEPNDQSTEEADSAANS